MIKKLFRQMLVTQIVSSMTVTLCMHFRFGVYPPHDARLNDVFVNVKPTGTVQ